VEGPIALTQCLHGSETLRSSEVVRSHECAIEGSCSVRGHWAPINHAVRAALDAVTLADLVKPAPDLIKPATTAPLSPAAANGELVA
jgi:DNA-binding IscR family transcriptional regulator